MLEAILRYFNKETNISEVKYKELGSRKKEREMYYKIHLSGKDFIERIVSHMKRNPLLGYKRKQYREWVEGH